VIAVPFVLAQRNLRRLLAYSTIDQAGILIIALGIGGNAAALGLMLHMTFHTIAKPLLFLSAGNIFQHFKTDLFKKIGGGVLRAMPLTGATFSIAAIAIVGMPPFSLFQSEFLIVSAAFGTGHVLPGVLLLACGTGIFAGVALHANRLIPGPAEGAAADWYPWRNSALLALATVLIVIGFWLPGPLLDLIRGAANVVSGR
jgi:hydrogenase-4 component F